MRQTLFSVPFGQHLRDGGALDLDVDPVGDLQREELLAELRDLAEDAAVGDDFGADFQRRDHGLCSLARLVCGRISRK